jgi:hypothetical protein
VVTITSTRPGWETVGAVAVRALDDTTPKEAAGTEPKLTPVAAERAVPWMVTIVPPEVGAEPGEMETAAGANWETFWYTTPP